MTYIQKKMFLHTSNLEGWKTLTHCDCDQNWNVKDLRTHTIFINMVRVYLGRLEEIMTKENSSQHFHINSIYL